MSTIFHHPVNNAAANVSAPRAAGVASVTVSDGSPFGTVFPLIVTATRAGVVLAILEVTGRDGNVLTVSGAIEGTADIALQAGDRLEMRPTALAITELQAAVLSDEADLASHVADTANPHGVTAAQVGAASAQWNASKLQGVAVATATPGDGQALVYSATAGAWAPQAVATGGGLTVGGPVAGGTPGRVLYEADGPVLADSADLVFDAAAKRLGIGVAAPGATVDLGLAGTLKAGLVMVNYNGPLGGPDTTWPDGSIFRQCVSPVLSGNDLFFQGLALPGAYFYLEDWQGLGLVLGTGNSDQPILLRPARTTVATVDSSGTILRVVAPSAADVPLALQAAAGQAADLLQVQDAFGSPLSRIYPSGAFGLATLADSAAPDDSIYLGSDHPDGNGAPKLCRKDNAGHVTVLG